MESLAFIDSHNLNLEVLLRYSIEHSNEDQQPHLKNVNVKCKLISP